MKCRELEEVAKKELQDELIGKKKELLKERIREIRKAKKVLVTLERQYQELLGEEIEEST